MKNSVLEKVKEILDTVVVQLRDYPNRSNVIRFKVKEEIIEAVLSKLEELKIIAREVESEIIEVKLHNIKFEKHKGKYELFIDEIPFIRI
ncbi:MAG TPA: hypothetical protein PLD02_10570 [Saprospiraceae bacterium]|nr:hypothetical protein [Saprospiraceae bacterium]